MGKTLRHSPAKNEPIRKKPYDIRSQKGEDDNGSSVKVDPEECQGENRIDDPPSSGDSYNFV